METIGTANNALVVSHNCQGQEPIPNHGCIERRQQILLREDIIVDGAGVVEQLGHALQTSQARTDEKLLEVAQYAHDHVVNTTADSEQRLGSRINEYFEDVQVHLEAMNKFHIDSQAADINKRLIDGVQDIHDRVDITMKASFQMFAKELDQKINSTLTTMEDAVLKASQDTFEATTDLQTEWIERRLNTKLKAAVERESKNLQFAQQDNLMKQEQKLQGQAAKLAKTYADSIEDRLQQKLDSAIRAASLHTHTEFEERFVSMTNKLKCDQVALKQDLRDDIQTNAAKLETKFQLQLSDFQAASTTDNNNLKHQIAQLTAATDRLNARLSAVKNQAAEGKDFTYSNTDGLTKKVLNRVTSVPVTSATTVDPVTDIATTSHEYQHLSGRRIDVQSCVNTDSGDPAVLTALNQISLGIQALLRKQLTP
ncbi:hypothetical protein F444_02567 [Phytophthora nicotianae P1976]|nr:hypothetical protein F444_02567 [Phytophthora nicotianae P1976]